MPVLKIDDGIKRYDVEDMEGRPLGTIAINPSDINLIKRVREFEPKINSLVAEALKTASGDGEERDKEQIIIHLDEEIKKCLDSLFDADVSGTIFKNQHCLNMSGGIPFVERFLNMILPVIEDEVKREQKASEQRKKKYTGRYKK